MLIAVVGAGLMGAGIAQVVAEAGLRVRLAPAAFGAFVESAPDAASSSMSTAALCSSTPIPRSSLFSRSELLGEPVEDLLPGRSRHVHTVHRATYRAGPARPMGAGHELYGLRKGGEEFPVDISLSPVETENGVVFAAAIRAITERRRPEAIRGRPTGARFWLRLGCA